MNHKIEIDKTYVMTETEGHVLMWRCRLKEYNGLPFGESRESTISEVTANSYSGLQVLIGNKGWHDLINKNQ